MKAIVVKEFGEPQVMHLEQVSELKPGPSQVVVRVRAAGVNPVDTYIRAGTYSRKPALPYTPGSDGAGEVLSAGKDVTRVKPGDRVYLAGTLTGSYAEQALCEEGSVFPLPAHVSFAQGAAIHVPYATAFRALFHRAHAAGGETVLIHGASGGTGIAAVQLAKAAGLRVVGTAGSDRGLKLILAEGAMLLSTTRPPAISTTLWRPQMGEDSMSSWKCSRTLTWATTCRFGFRRPRGGDRQPRERRNHASRRNVARRHHSGHELVKLHTAGAFQHSFGSGRGSGE